MSAFFVGVDHINAILTWAESSRHCVPVPLRGRVNRPTDSDLTEVGKELLRENIKSLAHRYPSDYAELLPDGFDVAEFRFVPDYGFLQRANLAVALIKLIHCYEYQACEHNAWDDSWSFHFCRWAVSMLTGDLPGYDDASWGYSRPDDAPQIVSLSRVAASLKHHDDDPGPHGSF